MQIIARAFSIEEFKTYVQNIHFNGWTPNFVVVHNTSAPTQALYKSWHDRKNWTIEQWLHNLVSYYVGMGWNACPHLFVTYDHICVLNALTAHGTHTPSWNSFSWGVETAAEFDREPFDNGVKENLIAALAILHTRVGLNPADFKLGVRGLHFHKEDVHTTHRDCPGKNLVKPELVKAVVDYMNGSHYPDAIQDAHPHISEAAQSADTSQLSVEELTSAKWLQTNLNKKFSSNLTVDGIIGKKTKDAVKAFQTKYNLTVDGIAGPLTRLKLKEI